MLKSTLCQCLYKINVTLSRPRALSALRMYRQRSNQHFLLLENQCLITPEYVTCIYCTTLSFWIASELSLIVCDSPNTSLQDYFSTAEVAVCPCILQFKVDHDQRPTRGPDPNGLVLNTEEPKSQGSPPAPVYNQAVSLISVGSFSSRVENKSLNLNPKPTGEMGSQTSGRLSEVSGHRYTL